MERIHHLAYTGGIGHVQRGEMLLRLLGRTPPGDAERKALRGMWQADSSGLSWNLGGIIAQSEQVSDEVAANAAALFRDHNADAAYVLAPMLLTGSRRRRLLALQALAGPLRAAEEEVVFHYACDAAWEYHAVKADDAFFTLGGRDARDAAFVRRLASVVREARRLIRGRHREQIEELSKRVISE